VKRTASLLLLATGACASDHDGAGGPEDSGSDTGALDAGSDAGAPATDAAAGVDDGVPLDAPFADDAGSTCSPGTTLGLFVWNDDLAPLRDAILALAAAHGVTEIYLHANLFYAGDLAEDVLAAWIDAAAARCIRVELLFGNAAWIRPATQIEATRRVEWSVAFAAAHPGSAPSGIHLDLEPQQLPEWTDDPATRPGPISDLVDLLETLTPTAEAGGLPLSLDMGFFLDGIDVTRAGRTRPAHEWLMDAVSRIVVMDYRDSARSTGHGGMIELAQTEVDYATNVARPIVLAVETQPVDPPYITFAEEGAAAMRAVLDEVDAHFSREPAFAGLAIHDRDGLAALGP
jgi:hypothetical protein